MALKVVSMALSGVSLVTTRADTACIGAFERCPDASTDPSYQRPADCLFTRIKFVLNL